MIQNDSQDEEVLTAKVGTESEADAANAANDEPFREVMSLLEKGEIAAAQTLLETFEERGAEWYYVQACIFRKKNWFTESRRSLQFALKIEPENALCLKMLEELDEIARVGHGDTKKKAKKREKHQMGGEDVNECFMAICCGCPMELCCGLICEGCSNW